MIQVTCEILEALSYLFIHSFIFNFLNTVAPSVDQQLLFRGPWQKFKNEIKEMNNIDKRRKRTCESIFQSFLKVAREDACLRSSSRRFQSLGPQKDISPLPIFSFPQSLVASQNDI